MANLKTLKNLITAKTGKEIKEAITEADREVEFDKDRQRDEKMHDLYLSLQIARQEPVISLYDIANTIADVLTIDERNALIRALKAEKEEEYTAEQAIEDKI